ncbi:purine catabolism regulatory protein [Oxobacter pfennigii]|uniref:Purine catabolism regulatory protein n=1 Tax=Oxobacter pfennigii TaxID=36849 RepID=A0A0N8NTT0_9CLOT|nr:PucR family transcriptional regulator [Oxobacter pfennigii]KPU45688.1 purine catabolism regulatory protein [Oxobacter pfennigii]
MHITIGSILNLPQLKNFRLLAGESGLDRRLSWVHVLELPVINESVMEGELVFMTGAGFNDITQDLVHIIDELDKKKSSGMVIRIGPYIERLPKEVLELANKLQFPIFETPYENNIMFIIQAICQRIMDDKKKMDSMNDFMKGLMLDRYSEDLVEMAVFFGYRPKWIYRGVIVDIDGFSNYLFEKQIEDESDIMKIKWNVMRIIEEVTTRFNKRILYFIDSDSFVLMIPVLDEAGSEAEVRGICEDICKEVSKKISGFTVSIGIGNCCNRLNEFKRSIMEANKSLKIIRACNKVNTVRSYAELGVYRLFFKIQDTDELKSIYYDAVEPLIKYDKNNNSDLLSTLEIYLDEDENISNTSKKMFLHRNTLKYRLAKIQEILGYNFDNVNQLFILRLAFKIKRFLGIN